jgi:hypothetical protein
MNWSGHFCGNGLILMTSLLILDELFADSKQSRDFVSLLIEPVTNCENIIALCLLEK